MGAFGTRARALRWFVPFAALGACVAACGALLGADDVGYGAGAEAGTDGSDATSPDVSTGDAGPSDAQHQPEADARYAGDGGPIFPNTTVGCAAYGPRPPLDVCDDFDEDGGLSKWLPYANAPAVDPDAGFSSPASMVVVTDTNSAVTRSVQDNDEIVLHFDARVDAPCSANIGPGLILLQPVLADGGSSQDSISLTLSQGVLSAQAPGAGSHDLSGALDANWHHVRLDWILRGAQPSLKVHLDGHLEVDTPSAAVDPVASYSLHIGIVFVIGAAAPCTIHYDNIAVIRP